MKKRNYALTAVGILLFLLGLYFLITMDNTQAFWATLPYVCIGVGCGIFGHGLGSILSAKAARKNPSMQKEMEINSHDERNIMIASRAKAKAYDLMIYVFAVLMLVFVLMGVDVIPILLFVFTYLFLQGFAFYFRYRLEKEM